MPVELTARMKAETWDSQAVALITAGVIATAGCSAPSVADYRATADPLESSVVTMKFAAPDSEQASITAHIQGGTNAASTTSPWGDKMEAFERRATRLRALSPGWTIDADGEPAGKAVDKRVLRLVEATVKEMKYWPPFLYALESGEIAAEWDVGEGMVRLEFTRARVRATMYPSGNTATGHIDHMPPKLLAKFVDSILTSSWNNGNTV